MYLITQLDVVTLYELDLLCVYDLDQAIDTIRHGYETNRKSNTKSHTDVMLGL